MVCFNYNVALCLRDGEGCADQEKATGLCREAAELGHLWAQYEIGKRGFSENDPERYIWWGKAGAQGNQHAIDWLMQSAVSQLELFDNGGGSVRILFEIGAACKRCVGPQSEMLDRGVSIEEFNAVSRVVVLYDKWCLDARRAIWCWIWAATKELGVAKDIRVLIGKMVWEEKAAWCERRK